MRIVNTDYISGKNLETIGLVQGTMVQSKLIGRDFAASFKGRVGGEIRGYTEMMNESRNVAIQRMIEEAQRLGADAVVNVKFGTSSIVQGAAEVIAYGTAVKFI
mgnify:FL=1